MTRLTEDQLQFLNKLESSIIRGRSGANRKERITKNSIIRAAIEILKPLAIDAREIPDEETLLKRIRAAMAAEKNTD